MSKGRDLLLEFFVGYDLAWLATAGIEVRAAARDRVRTCVDKATLVATLLLAVFSRGGLCVHDLNTRFRSSRPFLVRMRSGGARRMGFLHFAAPLSLHRRMMMTNGAVRITRLGGGALGLRR